MSTATLPLHPNTLSPRALLTRQVKALATAHGLTVTAVTSTAAFPELAEHLADHIAAGRMAGLDWFTAERARFSCSPRNLQASARSILAVGVAYWSVDPGPPADGVRRGRISRYAWGVDYHKLVRQRLKALHAAIETLVGRPIEARHLVDTARIPERAVARRAGLGWIGKHSCLIVPRLGSGVLLGELMLDLDLEPDPPLNRDCGRCQICLDACPTGAIVAPYVVDTPRCLSFQTIENRGAIPTALRPHLGDWVYGCDICQEVCPYTKAMVPAPDPAFLPRTVANAYPALAWLLTMSEEEFRAVYTGTPVTRAKRAGLARNAAVALGNIGDDADIPALALAAAEDESPLVRGHAAWALGQLGAVAALRRLQDRERDAGVQAEIAAALQAPARTTSADASPAATVARAATRIT